MPFLQKQILQLLSKPLSLKSRVHGTQNIREAWLGIRYIIFILLLWAEEKYSFVQF